MHLKQYDASADCFKRANGIQRHDMTYVQLGKVYTLQEEYRTAIEVYLEALEFSPEARAFTRRAPPPRSAPAAPARTANRGWSAQLPVVPSPHAQPLPAIAEPGAAHDGRPALPAAR
jgi:tetratricopeptide (TPR) repeat protein